MFSILILKMSSFFGRVQALYLNLHGFSSFFKQSTCLLQCSRVVSLQIILHIRCNHCFFFRHPSWFGQISDVKCSSTDMLLVLSQLDTKVPPVFIYCSELVRLEKAIEQHDNLLKNFTLGKCRKATSSHNFRKRLTQKMELHEVGCGVR